MDHSTVTVGTGGTMAISPVLYRLQGKTFHKTRSDQPNISAFRRSDNRPTTGFTPHEQKFQQNNNQTSSNVVHFTTTDETINELSDLCPLNC